MATPASLATAQSLLWHLITAPEGVAAALRQEPASEALLAEVVASDARLSAVERVDIYANGYFYRLLDCLKEDYPAVRAAVGESEFHNLVTDYLLAHPPTQPSLRHAGRHLSPFSTSHRLTASHPFLPDLSRLEWAILDSFDAPDGVAIGTADLRSIPADAWPAVRFTAEPSVQMIETAWAVQEVWERCNVGEPAGQAQPQPECLQVWRRDLRVFHRRLSELERSCMRHLLAGHPFEPWCEDAVDLVGDQDAAAAVSEVLRRWADEGVLGGVSA